MAPRSRCWVTRGSAQHAIVVAPARGRFDKERGRVAHHSGDRWPRFALLHRHCPQRSPATSAYQRWKHASPDARGTCNRSIASLSAVASPIMPCDRWPAGSAERPCQHVGRGPRHCCSYSRSHTVTVGALPAGSRTWSIPRLPPVRAHSGVSAPCTGPARLAAPTETVFTPRWTTAARR